MREPDLVILQASDNAALVLGCTDAVIGASLSVLGGDLADCILAHYGRISGSVPVALRCRVGPARRECDAILHRPASGGLAIELEPAGPALDVSARVQAALEPILAADSVARLSEASARIFQELTGYDRALVFRFDEDGRGQVIAERRKPGIPSCLGQHFGDAEAPPKAHLLIERNRIRHLVDADEPPVAVRPSSSPLTGLELDLSCSTWRSLSPVHLRFMERLGVRGALVASLLVGGRLWGLIVCHHRTPRFVHYPVRLVCELLAEAAATRITAFEAELQARSECAVLALERRLVAAIAQHGDWTQAVVECPEVVLAPVAATGALIAFEGKRLTLGQTPEAASLDGILGWLEHQPRADVITSAVACATGASACGDWLATPLSSADGELLVWFRAAAPPDRARAQIVRHPSLPQGHPLIGWSDSDIFASAEARQSPRPWSAADQVSARLIADSIADVIQQFRAVRVLLAQAQLAQASARVNLSDQPVLIAGADGAVLVTTSAWRRLLERGDHPFERLLDLAALCPDPRIAEHHLRSLMTLHRAWHGRICLRIDGATQAHFIVRAEPVLLCPGQLLGFVVALSDCTGQVALQGAGERFQEQVEAVLRAGRLRQANADLGSGSRLLSALAENASRAVLDSSASPDPQRGCALVAGVETSLDRTNQLLDRLLAYASLSSRRS